MKLEKGIRIEKAGGYISQGLLQIRDTYEDSVPVKQQRWATNGMIS